MTAGNAKPTDDLFHRHLLGHTSREEAQKLAAWLDEAEDHRREFREFKRWWTQFTPENPPIGLDLDQSWARLRQRLALSDDHQNRLLDQPFSFPKKRRRFPLFHFAAAAAMILAIISVWTILGTQSAWEVVETVHGQQREVSLPDGSVLTVNAGSTLRYRSDFAKTTRDVHLSGQAFFNVAKGQKPFRVHTANAVVEVLGTQFDVWERRGSTRLIVTEGQVSFSSNTAGHAQMITANQMSRCDGDQPPLAPIAIAAGDYVAWIAGELAFYDEPLSAIALDLEQQFGTQITLADSGIGLMKLTATFGNAPLNTVLREICLALDLKYTISEGVCHIHH